MNGYPNYILLFALSFVSLSLCATVSSRKLINAVMKGDREKVQELIDAGADVDAQDLYGRTALMVAIDLHQKDIVELLLKHNANVNILDKEGQTPLMFAVSCANDAMVELLLGAGADVTFKDDNGKTALDIAREEFAKLEEGQNYLKILYKKIGRMLVKAYIDRRKLEGAIQEALKSLPLPKDITVTHIEPFVVDIIYV